MRRPRVLIFLIFDLSVVAGNVLRGKHFLEKMAQLPDIDFTVVFSSPPNIQATNQEYANALGLDSTFVPFRLPVMQDDKNRRSCAR